MPERPIHWIRPGDPAENFPPLGSALREPDGLLAAGGDLAVERLLWAYRHGIFPWYESGQPILWWSPDPRCVFLPGDFRLASRTRRAARRSGAEVRINRAFESVMQACAAPRRHQSGTWITAEMFAAYAALHTSGWAHSIEVWASGKLIGGLYGLAIGRAFFGESMFSGAPNASKFALAVLARELHAGRLDLLDCQVASPHLASLGARTVPRPEFVERLRRAGCESPEPFAFGEIDPIPVARLVQD